MQLSITIPPTSQTLQFSWKPHVPKSSFPQNPNFITLKPSSLSCSFKSSPHSAFHQPSIVPVVFKNNDKVYKYFWDCNSSLKLVCVDGDNPPVFAHGGFTRLLRLFGSGVRDFLIPKQVTENYIKYVKWKFLHRVFSSALQVLATQAMFRAIGVGYSQSLPSAAALNWVLKEGLGKLSRCIYTACVGSAFDTNLKWVRFVTSLMFSFSIGVELMTPVFPNCFLLLASVANIAKQISLACYLATGTAVHRSFALADNLGEVSAKAQIQTTLTKGRLEIVLNTWIESAYVPSPAEVSRLEGICPPMNGGRKNKEWPIRIGFIDPKRQIQNLTMLTISSLSSEDFYFISMERCGLGGSRQRGILLSLREGARTVDIIMGLLQACYACKAIHSSRSKWENNAEVSDTSDSVAMEWVRLMEDSKHLAQGDINMLYEQILKSSWAAKNILLGTEEQARYTFIGDDNS